jgi:hypothetical protein
MRAMLYVLMGAILAVLTRSCYAALGRRLGRRGKPLPQVNELVAASRIVAPSGSSGISIMPESELCACNFKVLPLGFSEIITTVRVVV